MKNGLSPVEVAEANLKSRQAQLQLEVDKLAGLEIGSAPYRAQQASINREKALLQVHVDRQKKEFAQREAQNYYALYQSVQEELNRQAAAKGLRFVLRFNQASKSSRDQKEISKELNSMVLYHRGIDITDEVLAARRVRSAPAPE